MAEWVGYYFLFYFGLALVPIGILIFLAFLAFLIESVKWICGKAGKWFGGE